MSYAPPTRASCASTRFVAAFSLPKLRRLGAEGVEMMTQKLERHLADSSLVGDGEPLTRVDLLVGIL
jgi:hypothetical protein